MHPHIVIDEFKEQESTKGDMELVALYNRVIGLDIHQAQITACALPGRVTHTQRKLSR
jgi:hypothetical protein